MSDNIYIPDAVAEEAAKYAELWTTIPEYRNHSPGLDNVDRLMSVLKPKAASSIIDLGCGTGGSGIAFERLGLNSWWLDITDAGLDDGVPRDKFIKAPLWADWLSGHWDYGFCVDVIEHLPTEYVMLSIDRILSACDVAWLQISHVQDRFGKLIGEPLHLTVKPHSWWTVRLGTLGNLLEARDLCGCGLYVVRRPC